MTEKEKNETKQFYYVYQITNTVTGKIYVGCHATDDIEDGYMGSGKYLKRAYEKHGKDNFSKNIISFHPNVVEMFEAEAKIVTPEFVDRNDTYNLAKGGGGGFMSREIYDSPTRSEKIRKVHIGRVSARTVDGTIIKIDKDDPRWISKELVGATEGKATVKDVEGNVLKVSVNDPRLKNGELTGVTKGLAVMKDKDGKRVQVPVDDPRIQSGELVGNTAGYVQSAEANEKRSIKQKGIPKYTPTVTCIFCRKVTNVGNFSRWHISCTTNMI